jgi:hypothetical protein
MKMTTMEDRMARYERRQEEIIQAINGQTDAMETQTATIRELISWLTKPASSDLPDLIKALISSTSTVSEQMVMVGAKMDALPEAVARAVTTGELPR